MSIPVLAAFILAAFAATLAGTGLALRALRRRAILDHPNDRSSHAVPTPRGGGWAVLPVILAAWSVAAAADPGSRVPVWTVCAAALGLGLVSWLDDLRDLSPRTRLIVQAIAVAAGLLVMDGEGRYLGGLLPPVLDALAAGLLWLWFVNLFNFMDGIDGISAAEGVCLGVGVALVATIAGLPAPAPVLGLTMAAAALGFLWWNWQPARIFLGDIGSIPMGYLLGWLLLSLSAAGAWAAALILPLYYLADATVTLLRRGMRGEIVWRAHRQHFYQRAVQRGLSHARVVLAILVTNLVLTVLALLTVWKIIWPSLGVSVLVVVILLAYLAGGLSPGVGRPKRSA